MESKSCIDTYVEKMPSLPKEWATLIATWICNLSCSGDPSCEEIKDCQTLTNLSEFSISGRRVCISFTNEEDVKVTRCFDFSVLVDTDGTCLREDWGILTPTQRWQAIVDKLCDCCNPVETTTTSTTTTTTSFCIECWTLSMYNPDEIPHDFTYFSLGCGIGGATVETVNPGETVYFCACPDGIAYEADQLVLEVIDMEGCNPPETTTTTTTTSP